MLVVTHRTYMKKHVIGGSGIFDSIANFAKRMISSNAAKTVASTISKAAATDIGKTALAAAKSAGAELAKTAISTAKDVAVSKAKQLIDKTSKKILTPQSVQTIQQLTALTPNVPVITQKSKDILASLVNSGVDAATFNINKYLGSGVMMKQRPQAVAIQDLVKQMNTHGARKSGSGLRLASM